MLPILLPARAVGSILYGLRQRLSVFGLLGSGEGSAGRAVTLPAYDLRCATATLAIAPLSPSTYRLFACALRYTTLPEPLPMAKRFRRSTNRQLTATIGSNRPHDVIVCATA